MWESFLAFGGMFIVDALHGVYIKYVNDERPFLAALLSGAIYFTVCMVTIDLVNEHWILIPATLGAACGTYASVLINKRLQ